MRLGVFISGTLHTLLILYAIVALPFSNGEIIPSVVPVELLTVDDMTNIMAKREDVPEPEEPEPPLEEKEPEPQKVAAVEPEPEPELDLEPEEVEIVPAEEEIAPEPEPEPKPEPEQAKAPPLPNIRPQMKPKPPKEKFNLDQIAALLDKLPDEEEKPRELQDVPGKPKPQEEEDLPDQGMGLQTALTLSEIDAFKVQMRRCWSVPAGAAYSENLIVTIRVYLNQNGTLTRAPLLVRDSRFNLSTNPFYRTAAESAVRAIQRCQPFRLPLDKYNRWKEMEIRFDPSSMVGR